MGTKARLKLLGLKDNMSTKSIKFYKYSIDIEDDTNFSSLKNIQNDKNPHITSKEETTKVDLFNGEFFCDRFYGINLELGDATPYSDSVVDTKDNLNPTIKPNPRKETEIELDKQFLLLIDISKKTIYLFPGTQKYRELAEERLSEKINHNHKVNITQNLNKESFENTLSTISELNFCFEEIDLFNQEDDLSVRLNEDKLHYDANSVSIAFKYKNKNIMPGLKNKITKLIKNKDNYQNLKIVGKDRNGLESIFQSDAILSALEVKAQLEEKTKKFDYKKTLEQLIAEIKKKENE